MTVTYDRKHDLLYIRLDEHTQDVTNRRVDDDIVLDIGAGERVVGIEILDASKRVDIESLPSVRYAEVV